MEIAIRFYNMHYDAEAILFASQCVNDFKKEHHSTKGTGAYNCVIYVRRPWQVAVWKTRSGNISAAVSPERRADAATN